MTADDLRKELGQCAESRRTAQRQFETATGAAGRLLTRVAETDGISMTEAAQILGVSRVTAYELLKR